jgi:hypothetical protein
MTRKVHIFSLYPQLNNEIPFPLSATTTPPIQECTSLGGLLRPHSSHPQRLWLCERGGEFQSLLFKDLVPMFQKALQQNNGNVADIDFIYCGSTNYGGGKPIIMISGQWFIGYLMWDRQLYKSVLICTLPRLFFFQVVRKNEHIWKRREENRALSITAVIYIKVFVLWTIEYQLYCMKCIFSMALDCLHIEPLN